MSLPFKPGDTVWAEFVTSVFSTGAASNADSLPTGKLNRNGTDDGAVTVTVANIDTGRYSATFVIPATYVAGDVLVLSIAATVSSVAGKGIVWQGRVGAGVIRSSTAQAGAAGTITLDASASATDNFYRGLWIAVISQTGAGQIRYCSGYVGSTKVASVTPNWITNPDSTSVFMLIPGPDVQNAADTYLVRAWSATVTAMGQPDRRSAMSGLRKLVNHIDTTTTAGILTVMREDDATTAFTQNVTTNASAQFIVTLN